MRKRIFSITIILILLLVSCKSVVENDDKEKMKKIIDTIVSYNGQYDEKISKYISEEKFYNSNYVVFYSYFLGNVHLTKYQSQVKSVVKDGDKYKVYMVINVKAVGDRIEDENDEDSEEPEAEGNNVPLEVTLSKKNNEFYIEETKEYDSLDEAIKEKKEFK